jgi:NCAIR mutase (PurE)-related protein
MNKDTIKFLETRGYTISDDREREELLLVIGQRSIGAGLNEIFIETDELKAIEQLGNIMKIIYSENTIRLIMKERKEEKENKRLEIKKRVQEREEEKGGKKTHIYTIETPIKMIAFSWFLQRWLLHVFIYDFPL